MLPQPFISSIKIQLGEAFEDFEAALEKPAPKSIRINPLKWKKDVNLEPVPWAEHAYYLSGEKSFTLDPLLHAGVYYVQEASSMFVEQALKQSVDLSKPLRVLDLCAAPGGKSTHLASLISGDSLLVSNEVIKARANILAENITKWGTGNVVVTNADPEHFSALESFFDVIVVDAPCSGEGMFRKDPAARDEWSEANVTLCAGRQQRILAEIWPSLREGGLLIYSTCTFNRLENEDNLKWLKESFDAEFLPLSVDADWGITEVIEGDIRGYRFYPHKVQGEGFFLAAVRKQGEEQLANPRKTKKPYFQFLGRTELPLWENWLKDDSVFTLCKKEDGIYAVPTDYYDEIEELGRQIRVVQAGVPLATLKGKDQIPAHEASLFTGFNRDRFTEIELDEKEVLLFLKKENFLLEDAPDGWLMMTYQQIPLGFVKKIGNRMNNNFPTEWRIRMSIDAGISKVII